MRVVAFSRTVAVVAILTCGWVPQSQAGPAANPLLYGTESKGTNLWHVQLTPSGNPPDSQINLFQSKSDSLQFFDSNTIIWTADNAATSTASNPKGTINVLQNINGVPSNTQIQPNLLNKAADLRISASHSPGSTFLWVSEFGDSVIGGGAVHKYSMNPVTFGLTEIRPAGAPNAPWLNTGLAGRKSRGDHDDCQ